MPVPITDVPSLREEFDRDGLSPLRVDELLTGFARLPLAEVRGVVAAFGLPSPRDKEHALAGLGDHLLAVMAAGPPVKKPLTTKTKGNPPTTDDVPPPAAPPVPPPAAPAAPVAGAAPADPAAALPPAPAAPAPAPVPEPAPAAPAPAAENYPVPVQAAAAPAQPPAAPPGTPVGPPQTPPSPAPAAVVDEREMPPSEPPPAPAPDPNAEDDDTDEDTDAEETDAEIEEADAEAASGETAPEEEEEEEDADEEPVDDAAEEEDAEEEDAEEEADPKEEEEAEYEDDGGGGGDSGEFAASPESILAEAALFGVTDRAAALVLAVAAGREPGLTAARRRAAYATTRTLHERHGLSPASAARKAVGFGSLPALEAAAATDATAAAILSDLRAAPSAYWSEVVSFGGEPRSRLWVEAELTAAGVAADLRPRVQDEAITFAVRERAARAATAIRRAVGSTVAGGRKVGRAAKSAAQGVHQAAKVTIRAVDKADKFLGRIGAPKGHGHEPHGGESSGGGNWNEDAHPRGAKGTDSGGQFVPKDGAGSGGGASATKSEFAPPNRGAGGGKRDKSERTGKSGKSGKLGGTSERAYGPPAEPTGPTTHAHAEHTGSKVGHTLTWVAEHLETAAHVLMHPGAAIMAAVASKVISSRVGFIKHAIHNIEGKIRKRYGEPAGTLILTSGIGTCFAGGLMLAGALHGHGHGGHDAHGGHGVPLLPHHDAGLQIAAAAHGDSGHHAMSPGEWAGLGFIAAIPAAIPGLHLLGALPAIALAETLLQSKQIVKLGGKALGAGLHAVRGAAASLKRAVGGRQLDKKWWKRKKQARFMEKSYREGELARVIATFAGPPDAPVCNLSPAAIEAAGREFAQELLKLYRDDIAAHQDEVADFLQKFGAVAAAGKAGKS